MMARVGNDSVLVVETNDYFMTGYKGPLWMHVDCISLTIQHFRPKYPVHCRNLFSFR